MQQLYATRGSLARFSKNMEIQRSLPLLRAFSEKSRGPRKQREMAWPRVRRLGGTERIPATCGASPPDSDVAFGYPPMAPFTALGGLAMQ